MQRISCTPYSAHLQSRGISKIHVIPIQHFTLSYLWWLLNFSMQPAKFTTTAKATPSKKHTFWHLLCFFFKGRKGLLPIWGLFLFQFHTTFTTPHTLDSAVPKQPWCEPSQPGELCRDHAALQPKPSAGKVWMLPAFLTGLFQAIQIKKQHWFYLLCFYLLSHHNLITSLHSFYIIRELL